MRTMTSRFSLVLLLIAAACGGEKAAPPPAGGAPAAAGDALTPFQLEHGIGPITSPIEVGAVDEELAEQGEKIFETKCSACHKMEERYVGPALGDVTVRRSPTFVMNMILAPDVMYSKHPAAKQLLGEYMTQMPNLGITEAEARQILEYLRTKAPSQSGS